MNDGVLRLELEDGFSLSLQECCGKHVRIMAANTSGDIVLNSEVSADEAQSIRDWLSDRLVETRIVVFKGGGGAS